MMRGVYTSYELSDHEPPTRSQNVALVAATLALFAGGVVTFILQMAGVYR